VNFNDKLLPVTHGPFVVWEGAFTQEEMDAIEAHGDGLAHQDAVIDGKTMRYDPDARITRVAWIERDARTEKFYDRMETVILSLKSQFFQFALGKLAPVQFAIYDGSHRGHFDWHVDYGRWSDHIRDDMRKLSITVQLSDPSGYEGGALQARIRSRIDVAPKGRGTVVAFPSYILHRVTPVTSGIRKSLVAWALGPDFR
jgi:PKHD-type hydroxylase